MKRQPRPPTRASVCGSELGPHVPEGGGERASRGPPPDGKAGPGLGCGWPAFETASKLVLPGGPGPPPMPPRGPAPPPRRALTRAPPRVRRAPAERAGGVPPPGRPAPPAGPRRAGRALLPQGPVTLHLAAGVRRGDPVLREGVPGARRHHLLRPEGGWREGAGGWDLRTDPQAWIQVCLQHHWCPGAPGLAARSRPGQHTLRAPTRARPRPSELRVSGGG